MSSNPVFWLSVGGFLMAALALSGGLVVWIEPERLRRILPGLVGLASGSLLGGALFHMLPLAMHASNHGAPMAIGPMVWVTLGFVVFLMLEILLRAAPSGLEPQVPLILLGDGMHNLLGGLAVGAAFLMDPAAGVAAWLAGAAPSSRHRTPDASNFP